MAPRLAKVFLTGAGLPQAWAGRERFVVLDTGFGLGHNFLALWDAWRRERRGCGQLHVVAVEARPPLRETLASAHGAGGEPSLQPLVSELLAQWQRSNPRQQWQSASNTRMGRGSISAGERESGLKLS